MSTLKGKVTLNREAFNKAMVKLKKTVVKVAKEIGRRMAVAGKAIAKGLAVGMAAAGIATLIAAKKILEAGDQIQKMGLKTGFSAEELTRLKHAAELSGSSIEGIDKSIKSMQKSIFDADRGTKLMIDNFEMLGLKVDDIKNLSPEEQFKIISERIADIENPSKKAALAMQLFGRTGRDLLPMLSEGSAGLQKMKDDADKLGITMSQDQVNRIAEFNDSVDRMKKSILGIFQAALGFEGMRTLVDRMTASIVTFRNSAFFQKSIQNISNLASNVLVAGNGIINVVSKTGSSFFKLAGIIGAAGIGAAVAFKTGLIIPVVGALAALQTFIAGLSLGQAIYDSFDFGNLWENIKTQFNAGLENIAALIDNKFGDMSDEDFNAVVGMNKEIVEKQWKQNEVVVGDVMDSFKKNFKQHNEDLMNLIGQQVGIDNVMEEVNKITDSYKKGVGEFEKAKMEQGENNQGAIGAQVEEARELNKQLAKAGKQVSFVVNMDKFKTSAPAKGGIGSRSLRAAGQKFRDRFKGANDNFKKSFQEINDRHRNHFVTAGFEEEELQRPRRRVAAPNLNARNFGGGQNIGQGVNNHSSTMSNLERLAKARNEKLDKLIALSGNKGKMKV